jgi:hypothetical protein
MEEVPSIVRLSREGPRTVIGQVRIDELDSLLQANQACLDELRAAGIDVTSEDETTEMESIKYALWLNPLRAAAFFAERVLLVEGTSEYGLITCLLGDGKLRTPQRGVCILDTLGLWNMHRFMNLLSGFRIPHAVLYDRDESTAKSKALEKTVLAARSAYTRSVDYLDKNLESVLGVPAPGRPDRKPQHIMWHLKTGKIEEAQLAVFCNKVQALLDA